MYDNVVHGGVLVGNKKWKWDCTKVFLCLWLGGLVVYGGLTVYFRVIKHDVMYFTFQTLIIDAEDKRYDESSFETMDKQDVHYVLKHENNGKYYISQKSDPNIPSVIECSKKDYDKMKSGETRYLECICNTAHLDEHGKLTKVYGYDPSAR